MSATRFPISAFGDEIADKLSDQLRVLEELDIGYLELRGVWGKNVLHLDDEEAAKIRQVCDRRGIKISCIGSPIGKSPLADPIATELANLDRIMQIADIVGTKRIRVFSFYPDDISTNAHYDQYVPEVIDRLSQLADRAAAHGFELFLENEREIVGDTVARCKALMAGLDKPNLHFIWDPANFVLCDEAHVTDDGWDVLGRYTTYVHVKDARLADGSIQPAGQGDGQIPELLTRLNETGGTVFLALEPHLAIAGHSSGFSGPEGMAHAAEALRGVMRAVGAEEGE